MLPSILICMVLGQTGTLVSGFCPAGSGVTCPKITAVRVGEDGTLQTAGGGGAVTANQGTPNAGGANSWWVQFPSAQSVNASQTGTWTVQQGTPPWSISGTVTANQGGAPWSVSQSGTWTIQQGTPPWSVSGTVTANQGTSPWVSDVTPASPVANDYLPVRLTDGSAFYTATGGGAASRPVTYVYQTPDSVGGANKVYLDIFNATGSGKIVKILGVYPLVKTDVGVTGVLGHRFDLYRTNAVGTGGTAANYKNATRDVAGGNITPRDTASAALPAQITARFLPTGGATTSEWLYRGQCFVEETNASTYVCSGQTNFINETAETGQFLTLRENEGLKIQQGAIASVNNVAYKIVFTTE